MINNEDYFYLKQKSLSLIKDLSNKNYLKIVSETKGIRLSEIEISEAIQLYNKTLIIPPPVAIEYIDIVEVKNSSFIKQWLIISPLWTLEEGVSDLSIQFTFIKHNNGYTIHLDDIRVF